MASKSLKRAYGRTMGRRPELLGWKISKPLGSGYDEKGVCPNNTSGCAVSRVGIPRGLGRNTRVSNGSNSDPTAKLTGARDRFDCGVLLGKG